MPNPTLPPTKLQIRAFDCKLSALKIKQGLEKLVEGSPAFNDSWLLGEFNIASRIGGLNQFGDIIVRHAKGRTKSTLTIEHRAGDAALAKEIESAFGRHLTPKAPRMIKGNKRPEGMAYFFEMIQRGKLKNRVVIADAVIEEAHDLNFDDYREVRNKLEFLAVMPRLGTLQSSLDSRIQRVYKETNRVHACPRVCLHEGQRVALPHRFDAISAKHDLILTLHFAKLPGYRVLVGWVEERRF